MRTDSITALIVAVLTWGAIMSFMSYFDNKVEVRYEK